MHQDILYWVIQVIRKKKLEKLSFVEGPMVANLGDNAQGLFCVFDKTGTKGLKGNQ